MKSPAVAPGNVISRRAPLVRTAQPVALYRAVARVTSSDCRGMPGWLAKGSAAGIEDPCERGGSSLRYKGASQNASHLISSSFSTVSGTPSRSSGSVCCWVTRRSPDTTRNSGVRSVATTCHAPPGGRTASSCSVGMPRFILKRMRTSLSSLPSQATVRTSSATVAVSPGWAW